MIHFNDASYTYQGLAEPTLSNLSFRLPEGSFHYLLGASGAGKTTLFRMLYLDLLPTGGSLNIFGREAHTLSRDEIARMRRHMGILFQDFRLLSYLTVRENVALPLTINGELTEEQNRCVDEILDWVGLGTKLGVYPDALSGGEQQRVAIARAVVNRPRLLIADEPTGNIDPEMGHRIMHLFTELNRHGTTVLIATHDQSLIRHHPAPVLRLEGGRMVHVRAA